MMPVFEEILPEREPLSVPGFHLMIRKNLSDFPLFLQKKPLLQRKHDNSVKSNMV